MIGWIVILCAAGVCATIMLVVEVRADQKFEKEKREKILKAMEKGEVIDF